MPGLTPDGHGHSVVNTHCSKQFEYKSHFRAASGMVVHEGSGLSHFFLSTFIRLSR